MATKTKSGRLKIKSLTPGERELIAAFLIDRYSDFLKAENVSRQMVSLRPDNAAFTHQLQYNMAAVAAMKHCISILGLDDGRSDKRVVVAAVGRGDDKASGSDVRREDGTAEARRDTSDEANGEGIPGTDAATEA